MTETFTASNKTVVVPETEDTFAMVGSHVIAKHGGFEALREYFRDERDRELGRWRSSVDPDFVGYPSRPGRVNLVNEVTGYREIYTRQQAKGYPQTEFDVIAKDYFEAHPEKKPWHNAKPGEVWVLTVEGEKRAALYHGEYCWRYGPEGLIVSSPGIRITEAKRIWPESKES